MPTSAAALLFIRMYTLESSRLPTCINKNGNFDILAGTTVVSPLPGTSMPAQVCTMGSIAPTGAYMGDYGNILKA